MKLIWRSHGRVVLVRDSPSLLASVISLRIFDQKRLLDAYLFLKKYGAVFSGSSGVIFPFYKEKQLYLPFIRKLLCQHNLFSCFSLVYLFKNVFFTCFDFIHHVHVIAVLLKTEKDFEINFSKYRNFGTDLKSYLWPNPRIIFACS